MITPIYMLYLIKRKAAWYQMTAEERDYIGQQTLKLTIQAGGKRVILCDTTWSTGACEFFELTEFPDLAAAQRRIELYEQVDLFRYYEITTLLGVQIGLQEHEVQLEG